MPPCCHQVVVADSRPEFEGRATLHKLLSAGIPCTYVHLNASSYIIKEVSKVFLGAAAVLSNGAVLGRAGNASIAMLAHAHSVPVLICAETHKFNERVQLDSVTHNELGDPGALAAVPGKPQIDELQVRACMQPHAHAHTPTHAAPQHQAFVKKTKCCCTHLICFAAELL